MKPGRRQQIESVCAEALSKVGPARVAFLHAACGGDAALRREVESLLAGQGSAEGFLDTPAWRAGAGALLSGERLGPYEILDLIGAGGMGEVYKARDTRLDRIVAIKILPSELGADPERRARFEREARAISSLAHPHICTLHDVGTHPSTGSTGSGQATLYLVMEHLAGETLAARLRRGAMPLAQALDVAAQIAEALDAAHKHGIVHRDLKPGNVMLATGGTGRSGASSAKLLDFGLAKLAAHGERPVLAGEATAPTMTAPVTARGTILGTLQYMAPEQLEGKEADARTDLWALGAMLYEMVTGRRAFEGDSQVTLIGNIMNVEPAAIATLQPLTPPALERVVKKCLAKHPDDRWDTAHDVADELRWIAQGSGASSPAVTSVRPRRQRGLMIAMTAPAALLLIAGGAGVIWLVRPSAQTPQGVVRAIVSVEPADRLQSTRGDVTVGEQRPSRTAIALSPDGRFLAFSAVKSGRQQLYLRPLAQLEATPIADSDGGHNPFFSPDGKWIGFWANGALRKISVAGGPATSICKTGTILGASWGDDDTIVFAGYLTGLFQVPAAGGTPRPLTTLDEPKGEVSHRLPHVLPGAKVVLFTVITHYLPDWDAAEIVAQPLPGGTRKTVARGADARYVPTGHLIFVRSGAVVAAPFDVRRLELAGGAVTVVNDVMQAANTPNSAIETGAAQLATSPSGLLAYATGGVFRDQERQLVWVDRTGKEEPLPLPSRAYLGPHLSPDGQQIVLWTQGRERIVWVYDVRRGTMTRVAGEGRNSRAIWTPDGRRVTFASATTGNDQMVLKAADGSGTFELLSTWGQPSSWSPDGRVLAFVEDKTPGKAVWLLSIGDGQRRRFVDSRFAETHPEFAPDGRSIAYVSNETGRNEVYVQPYPGPGERKQLSNNGGTQPAWARNGRELFYTEEDTRMLRTRMMSVPLQPGPQLIVGVPRLVFEGTFRAQANTRGYDVTPDGQRFLMVRTMERPPTPVTQLVLVQNWFEELKAKVPGG